jgi:hypothetical protein
MVSLDKYPCFCGSGLQRIESKDGSRGFLKCKTETCTLFIPEEKYTELFEAYEMRVDSRFKSNNFPLCDCEDVSSLWVSHSSKNPERPYFRCQDTSADTKCDFFQWADTKLKRKRKAAGRERVLKQKVQSEKRTLRKLKPLESSDEENNAS